jgi:hypothetical protein
MQGADKNYAPPKARVADVETVRVPMPREVWIAIFLLYAVLVLIATGYVVASKRLWPPYFEYGLVAVGALWALVPYFIGRRNRVARVVLLIVVLLALVGTVLNLVLHVHGPTIPRPMAWAALVMRVIALCLLYTRPANAWFSGESSSMHKN